MIENWLNLITNIPNDKIRETLYNIEAFRADALNFQLENKGTKDRNSTDEKTKIKGISSNTKTSGNSNLVSGGSGSNLTGKNPFAILKASAIASTC